MLSYAATRNSSVFKGETFELELDGDALRRLGLGRRLARVSGF